MKTYPTISGLIPKMKEQILGDHVYLFGKQDGSNIRVEWNPKAGFYKYGRRHGLLDDSNPVLKEAPALFRNKYEDAFDSQLRRTGKIESAVIYFEFFGPNSHFGNHVDESHDIQVFDISIYKRGFLKPLDFIRFMGSYPTGLVWEGRLNETILNHVRNSDLPDMPFEGVVGKTDNGKVYFKYKSQAWYDSLKEHCGNNHDLYNILK